ncbi:DUF6111 family protein [Roseibium salinum]|uniref:DUF6111 family protein n=1 Tax=Roseibium salinum TaxID=1604349 RepID=A0ABT3RA14_9HYPH|nr:DUF6111 family protein [Roseibium sp. DSM 29163]MCX2725842.1 DUF6111 family protein [Roseibium sp. DSM 29163]
MLRFVVIHIILFLLPFFCYAIWLWLSKRSKHPDSWTKGPIAWLTLAGLVLVIAGLVVMAVTDTSPEGKNFRPSEMRDGVFVPGRFE